ncbi:hypothetical protein FDZ71_08695, partial [bacterium]
MKKPALAPLAVALAALWAVGCGSDVNFGVWTPPDDGSGSGASLTYGQDFLGDLYAQAAYGDYIYATDPSTNLVIKLDAAKQGTSSEFVWEAG